MSTHTEKKARIDSTLTTKSMFGYAGAWDDVVNWLLRKAGDAFSVAKDDDAHLLRRLADEAKELAKNARAEALKHEKEWEHMTEEDWK